MSIKSTIIGSAIALVTGAGAMAGLMQIPSVSSAVVKGNTNSPSYDSVEVDTELAEVKARNTVLEEENTTLKSEKATLVTDLATARQSLAEKTSSLTTALAQIEEKDTAISQKQAQITSLQGEIATLNSQIANYEELLGEDIVYADIVGTLNAQLAEKTSALSTATAELEQLRTDKTALQTRVAELELELADAEERLANYESLENIDRLNVSNFDGIWYKNGTWEDYFEIDNGIVTRGAGEDRGVLQNLYSQMYLFMNTAGSIPVELAIDGLSFSLGQDTYTKFYINTRETVVPNNVDFAGTYSYSDKTIKFNVDNTLEFTDGNDTYHGAYLVTGIKTNIGGNEQIKYTITATIHEDEDDVIKVFEFNVGDNKVIDSSGSWSNIELASFNFNDYTPIINNSTYNQYRCDCLYYRLKINSSIKYNKISLSLPGMTNTSSSNSAFYVNGVEAIYASYSNANSRKNFDILVDNPVGYLDLYIGSRYNSSTYGSTTYNGNISNFDFGSSIVLYLDNTVVDYIPIEIVDFKLLGYYKDYVLSGSSISYLKSMYLHFNSSSENLYYLVLSPLNDYINGIYENGESQIVITDNSVTLQMTAEDDPVVATKTVSAKTDGYHIYQTVTITYQTVETDENEVETTIDHEIVMEFTDDECMTVTMDNVQIYPAIEVGE